MWVFFIIRSKLLKYAFEKLEWINIVWIELVFFSSRFYPNFYDLWSYKYLSYTHIECFYPIIYLKILSIKFCFLDYDEWRRNRGACCNYFSHFITNKKINKKRMCLVKPWLARMTAGNFEWLREISRKKTSQWEMLWQLKQEAEEAWKLTTINKNLTRESNFWIDFRTMRS